MAAGSTTRRTRPFVIYGKKLISMYLRAYESPEVLDLTELCILKGKSCWILYVDILVLGKLSRGLIG